MAKSLNRGLGALAALGALSYHLSKSGGGGGGNRAPVDDRNVDPTQGYDTAGAEGFMPGAADQGDTGDFLSRRLRVNPETGQAYSMDNLSPMGGGGGAAPAGGGGRPSPRPSAAPSGMSAAAMDAGYANRAAPPVRPTPSAGAGRGGQGGPTAAELEAYRNRPYNPPPMTPEMRRQAEQQGLENVYPEQFFTPAPGLKTLHSAAKALAGRTAGGAERSTAPYLKELGAPSRQGALPAPQGRISGPSKSDLMARDRAGREAARREEMLRENAEAYGLNPNAPGYEAAARALREKLGGSEFTVKKKGGAIKAKPKKMASGGMTSASKRADGIASKGKTKCKMY